MTKVGSYRTKISLPSETWGAYKANLTGFLGEVFASYYIIENYSIIENNQINIIRKQLNDTIWNIFFGETTQSLFTPRVIDKTVKKTIILPIGASVKKGYGISFQVPGDIVGEIEKKAHILAGKELFWSVRRDVRHTVYLKDEKIYVLLTDVESLIEIIRTILLIPKIIDFAIIEAKIKRIIETSDDYEIMEGTPQELILYEVKSGKDPIFKDEILSVVEAVEGIDSKLKIKLKLARIRFEVVFPTTVIMDVTEYESK